LDTESTANYHAFISTKNRTKPFDSSLILCIDISVVFPPVVNDPPLIASCQVSGRLFQDCRRFLDCRIIVMELESKLVDDYGIFIATAT